MLCPEHAVVDVSFGRQFAAPKKVWELDGNELKKVSACDRCLPRGSYGEKKLSHAIKHEKGRPCDCKAQLLAQMRKAFKPY